MPDPSKHDGLTAAAIAALAFLVADISHEALGHGLAAQILGARHLVLAYTYLTSDLQSRWISAAGPLVNAGEGLLAFLLLRRFRMRAASALFVFLLYNFNLLVLAAYLVYSGVSNSGDLGAVIAGTPHVGVVRIVMILLGLGLYGAFARLGGRELRRFAPPRETLTTAAYFTALALNCGAALLNPLGLKYFLISALPATAAANAAMLAMPALAQGAQPESAALRVERNVGWWIVALAAAAIYIFVLGPGITLK